MNDVLIHTHREETVSLIIHISRQSTVTRACGIVGKVVRMEKIVAELMKSLEVSASLRTLNDVQVL